MDLIQFDEEICPDPSIAALLEPVVESACARYNLTERVQVIITTDRHMQFLNSTFRDRCQPTDVLSFDLANSTDQMFTAQEDDNTAHAEIYISLERANKQAQMRDIPLNAELSRLVAHGLLHLAGYDHKTVDDLRVMESETERLIRHCACCDSEAQN